VVAVRLVINWSVGSDLIASGNGWIGGLGLTLLSVLYLPNVVIGAAGALVGAPVAVGGASVDLFGSHGGQVPPLPILAVLPDGGAGRWTSLLLVGVFAVSLLVARLCLDLSLLRNIRAIVVAAATSSLIVVLASVLAGGELGVLGTAGANLPVAGVFTFGWIAVTGTVTALIYSALPSTRRARASVIDDYYNDDEHHDRDDENPGEHPENADENNVTVVADEAAIEFVPAAAADDPDNNHPKRRDRPEKAVTIDGWDPEEWALEEEWDDADRGPIDEAITSSDDEELVSTDDFGTRRSR
jgi:hypothetical protein